MPPNKKLLVWDIPTRLTHWLLLILVVYAWFAVEVLEDIQQHIWAGYGVLGVVLFRLVWGFVGTYHARFGNFLVSPQKIWRYSKTLSQPNSKASLGHNPMGGLSSIVLLLVILTQAVTGLFNSDDYFHGPLSGLVGEQARGVLGLVHELNFNLACALIALHVCAIIFYKLYKGQALTSAMISGKKPASPGDQTIAGSKLLLALFVLLICAGLVYTIATGFTDTLPSSEFDYNF